VADPPKKAPKTRRFLKCPACGQLAPCDPAPPVKSAVQRFTAAHTPTAAVQQIGGYAGIKWADDDLSPDERALLVGAMERALARLRA